MLLVSSCAFKVEVPAVFHCLDQREYVSRPEKTYKCPRFSLRREKKVI